MACVLVLMGTEAARRSQTGGAARRATRTVTTGFAAVGTGVAAPIGAVLPILLRGDVCGLCAALGLAFVALGVGFVLAAARLREILEATRRTAAT